MERKEAACRLHRMGKVTGSRLAGSSRFGAFARLRRRWAAARRRGGPGTRAPDARRRIAIGALLIAAVCGLIDLPLPAEDSLRAARAAVRMHQADQSVVVVTIDDRSLNALGRNEPLRSDDARFLDRLFELGAKRVYFDRAYADLTTPAEDRAFRDALKRHGPQVALAVLPDTPQPDGQAVSVWPNALFRPHARVVSIEGLEGPFDLSVAFSTQSVVDGRTYPTMSSDLAKVDYGPAIYRVDFAIDYETIPRVSYIDVLQGRVSASAIAGRDVVVAPSSRLSIDYHPIPFRGKAFGAFHHVLGAETLKGGPPIDFKWYPAFLLAIVVLLVQARRPRPSKRAVAATVALLLAGPIWLDGRNINLDVTPALIAIAIGVIRLQRLANRTYRGSTGLQRLETLQDRQVAADVDVIALKIRNFATISANLAPEEVEELLAKAQAMLRSTEPGADFAFEKDTLVWLRPPVSPAELDHHLRGLHAMFRTSISIGSHAPDVASSLGIDGIHDAPLRERIENAMQCAEDAAHANRIYMVSEPELAADRAWRVQILSELESAIGNGEVEVVFQPKVALADGAIIGAEALMRWQHPTRGAIDPAMVISYAEEHNRVDMITRFVIARAMRDSGRAVAIDPDFKVAVNISALDLCDPGFVAQLQRLLAAERFPVGNLVLEITETAPIENDPTVAQTLAALKRLGVRLSVDDFGIGHASLHYLRQIPADEVKIDRSFVVGMETSTEDRALVRTAIDMIHSLGRTAVAEGVETRATVELLRQMGCDTAQGYFYYRPMPIDALLTHLRKKAAAA